MPHFPERIELKQRKCPSCGDKLGRPALNPHDATVRVLCAKDACGYAIDLGWLGDVMPSVN